MGRASRAVQNLIPILCKSQIAEIVPIIPLSPIIRSLGRGTKKRRGRSGSVARGAQIGSFVKSDKFLLPPSLLFPEPHSVRLDRLASLSVIVSHPTREEFQDLAAQSTGGKIVTRKGGG